ncbi:hypothetical protein AMTR_s00130p00034030 [Amborella trichopoda]|uniref:Uncharacterized protein n=1 Tax=Amborella trichopoda TaxID=13333 RepID=W1NPD0_AMBTC|nr:hypothetical protein AMTR_s00130p00034030 [Amborella trichopoda]
MLPQEVHSQGLLHQKKRPGSGNGSQRDVLATLTIGDSRENVYGMVLITPHNSSHFKVKRDG